MIKKNEPPVPFKKRLADILTSCHIEQKDLARIGDVKPSTISNYIKGSSEPNQSVLAKWALEWNINLNWLLLDEGNMLRTAQGTPPEAAEIDRLKDKIIALQDELNSAKNTIIALQAERSPGPQMDKSELKKPA